MNLSDASKEALAAARAGDWDRLERALEARGVVLAAGAQADIDQLKLGEELRAEIVALRSGVSQEEARLRQLELGFASGSQDPDVELLG